MRWGWEWQVMSGVDGGVGTRCRDGGKKGKADSEGMVEAGGMWKKELYIGRWEIV